MVSEHGTALGNRSPALYDSILYSCALESRAFRRLAELDVAGCRKTLGRLVAGLDLTDPGCTRKVVQLLLDILQKVNRRVHRSPTEDRTYQANRVRLIEQFSPCESSDQARVLFLGALNRLLAPLEQRGPGLHPLIERAKAHIEDNYHRRIFLSSVARALNISPNYLSRLFRRETGTTLTAYVQRVRMHDAMLLLADGRHSISEIAYLVGYQNYRDFYRNFVKQQNRSPRQVRQQLVRSSVGFTLTDRPSVRADPLRPHGHAD